MPRQTVLITGCSAGGIGSALAIAFAERGCKVFATARNLDKMSHLHGNPSISTLQLDPTSSESVDACVKQVETELASDKNTIAGYLDYLINNAGMSANAPILDADIDEMKAMYEINIWGCVRVTQKFSHLVINAKGTIVMNSSIGSTARFPFLAFYASTKVALNQITDTLRMELAPFGVQVVTLMTGAIKSGISKKENVATWKLPENSRYKSIESEIARTYQGTDLECMETDEYAKYVAQNVLAGANGSIWKGKFATVSWILYQFFPRWLVDIITVANSGIGKLGK
ncbi:uncharacterized protein MYCFIDRAFT_204303 [Pseudocercospora fijiensis CIRAD86]|uniref:Uncharacterized protein n=1 Tax=Pseudocercospora fijiensis (strain CIRAD86) TaxID=383855 RepID=M3AWA8_PSEFD|nr:uncharacterized protein MYCFIDRAFT_204303 [Pseudocercospora fijiensis CIRAD86]EME81418.1 hypothetical protein MYCFIDRAFT_204303 [Pseudocercospora fijiensis CIRAD86]